MTPGLAKRHYSEDSVVWQLDSDVLEPILNPIWVLLLVGERPDLWAVAGCALVLGAIVFRYTR